MVENCSDKEIHGPSGFVGMLRFEIDPGSTTVRPCYQFYRGTTVAERIFGRSEIRLDR